MVFCIMFNRIDVLQAFKGKDSAFLWCFESCSIGLMYCMYSNSELMYEVLRKHVGGRWSKLALRLSARMFV